MSYGLYIHLPFCIRKCPYCSFVSGTGIYSLMDRYALSASKEIQNRTSPFLEKPRTIYIGGGTPSIVPYENIKTILADSLYSSCLEFTVEANPESITEDWLKGIRELGANRISIGLQSLDDEILKNLGRQHTADQALRAVEIARNSGFRNISVDLMFGVPGQTLEIWEKTLKSVCDLNPEHVSCYSLGIEEDTEYFERMSTSQLIIPSQEETADMYVFMSEMLESKGLNRYEISNFARTGHECKHNIGYWDFTPYLGIGVSAHSYDGNARKWNETNIEKYLQRMDEDGESVSGYEIADDRTHLIERIMLSLRMRSGLDSASFASSDLIDRSIYEEKIKGMVDNGFLIMDADSRCYLSETGAVLADEIISELITDIFPE